MIYKILVYCLLILANSNNFSFVSKSFSFEAYGGQYIFNNVNVLCGPTDFPVSIWIGGGQLQNKIRNTHILIFLSGEYGYSKNLKYSTFYGTPPAVKYALYDFSSGIMYENQIINNLFYSIGPAIKYLHTSFFIDDTSSHPRVADTTLYNNYLYPAIKGGVQFNIFSGCFLKFQAEVGYLNAFRWGCFYTDVTSNTYSFRVYPVFNLGLGFILK